MKAPRTLFLTYDGLSDPLGQSQILPYLQGLREEGYRVSVISCEKPASLNRAGGLTALRLGIESLGLDWHPLIYHKQPPVLSTVYDIVQMHRTARRLHGQEPFALIHSRSYPPALAGAPLCRAGRRPPKFLFDMRGFWADERVDGGLWNLENPIYRMIYRFFKRKEREFLTRADAVVSLTYAAKTEIQSWFPNSLKSDIRVIPCCCDARLFDPNSADPEAVKEMSGELKLSADDFVLGYLGSLGTWYLLEEMLLFFRQLLQERPTAKFLFITNDPDEGIYERAENLGIFRSSLRVTSLSRQRIPVALMLVNLGISFIKPSYSKMASSPTKLAEMLSMGVPVVCNAGVGDAAYLHARYNIGPLVNVLNEEGYAAAIGELPTYLDDARQVRRESALRYFSLDRASAKYSTIYQELTGFEGSSC